MTEFLIEIGDAVVVRVASKVNLPLGRPAFDNLGPMPNDGQFTLIARRKRRIDESLWAKVHRGRGRHSN